MMFLMYLVLTLFPEHTIACENPDEDVTELVHNLGGSVHRNRNGAITKIRLTNATLNNDHSDKISRVESIEEIYMGNARVRDARSFQHFATLRRLDVLALPNTNVADEGVKHLGDAKSLAFLYLDFCPIMDKSCATLSKASSLVELWISHTNITDAGVKLLSNSKSIEHLNLTGTKITDVGLLKLTAMPSLKEVDISGAKVTEKGITALQQLRPSLKIIVR